MPINPNAVFGTHHLSPHHLWHTTLSHTILCHTIFNTLFCHTPSFTHNCFLSHTTFTRTIFHTQLCHIHHFLCRTPFFTHNIVTYTHTPFFFVKYNLSHTTLSHTHTTLHIQLVLLLDPPPPPLSFLPSLSPLEYLLLTIGRSWLVGLSGPLIDIHYLDLFKK